MVLKNGKFWQDGKVVPAEHGNMDQINLLRQVHEMTNDGFKPIIEIRKKVVFSFKCVCGHYVDLKDMPDMDEDEDHEIILRGEEGECIDCKIKYVVCVDDEEGLILKMKHKKK
jgi:hypothetical protein